MGLAGNYYTTGIFDEHVNMPTYMHQRTGVHGCVCSPLGCNCGPLGGLGETPACHPPGEVANELFDVVRSLSGHVPIPGVSSVLSTFGVSASPTLGDIIDGLRGTLVPLLANELQKGGREWNRGRDAIIHWLAQKIAQAADMGGAATAIERGLQAAAGAHLDKFVGINICSGQSAEMSMVMVAQPQAAAPAFNLASLAQMRQPTAIDYLQSLTPEERAMAARATSLTPAQPPATTGRKTAMLVGAAALAALLLLR
jgi:hypothetical protein